MAKITLDHYQVSTKEAEVLMIHHLMLAAMYFEGTVDGDIDGMLNRMSTSMEVHLPLGHREPVHIAAEAFIEAIDAAYDMMGD